MTGCHHDYQPQRRRLLLPEDAAAGWAMDCSPCGSLGCTPLHVAAYYGQAEALQVRHEAGDVTSMCCVRR
jgi:hypothetical protein